VPLAKPTSISIRTHSTLERSRKPINISAQESDFETSEKLGASRISADITTRFSPDMISYYLSLN